MLIGDFYTVAQKILLIHKIASMCLWLR